MFVYCLFYYRLLTVSIIGERNRTREEERDFTSVNKSKVKTKKCAGKTDGKRYPVVPPVFNETLYVPTATFV